MSHPTEKMLAAAHQAALRHGVPLPKGIEANETVCRDFLNKYLTRPTAKALQFAEALQAKTGKVIPDEARENARLLSAWIDEVAHA